MQIILLESIPHVGQLGDVVKVKDGFARNYLIPTKKAKRATAAAIEEFKAHKAELERAQAERLAKAEELKGKIDGLTITIASKAGVDGRLFGSVTNMDVAEALKNLVSISTRARFVHRWVLSKPSASTRCRSTCTTTSLLMSTFRLLLKPN